MANGQDLRGVQKQVVPEGFLEELGTLDVTGEAELGSQGACCGVSPYLDPAWEHAKIEMEKE